MLLKFVLVLLSAALINGQMDKSFCDPATIVTAQPQIPFPLPGSLVLQYQMSMEINSDLTRSTMEIDQYFDGLLNRAVNIYIDKGVEFRIFTYDATDEVITVTGDLCFVQKASQASLSPTPSILINGTEHIISPLQLLHLQNPDMKEVYIGKSVIKGVPVLQWQVCNYIAATQVTQRLTYSISEPGLWQVAVPYANVSAVPVEFKVENKNSSRQWTDIYSITKFRAGIRTRDEFWVTPTGVYCPARQLGTKRPPKVPQVFQFRATVVSPLPGFDDLLGEISNIREVYDYPNKLFRIDYSKRSRPYSEIHDYRTGLRYIRDRFEGNCTIATIDPESFEAQTAGGFITMKNSTSFFDFDSTPYQYVGQKHVNHINCDVWIGQKKFMNLTTNWEWYFMADGYLQQSGLAVEVNEPVLLIITFFQPFINNQTQQPDYIKVPVYYYFNDYDETGLDTFEFNIGSCMEKYPKKHFSFELPDDYRDLMEKYKTNLYLGVLIGISSNTAVYPTRVNNLQIDFNSDNIVVVFTLLDKAPFYGNVNMTLPEVSLDDASALLNATIAAGKLYIPFIIDNSTYFELIARPKSLRELETVSSGVVYISKETIKKVGYSGGQVAGITIGILVLSIAIGLVAGVFFCIYKPDTIPIDKINNFSPIDKIGGFINPAYKKGASDA